MTLFHIGQRVRLRSTGEELTVAKFAGSSNRPSLVCEDDDPESDWRICAPADLEPVNEPEPQRLRLASKPEVPAQVTAVAILHQLAKDLDGERRTDYADRVRAVIAKLGFETIALDELLAEAAVLAAHAPGVQIEARATGDRLLSVVGE
ncbi:hypothetical protein ACIBG0_38755 [Nocardia sp. NPDC050630]|uniref:hypothetical protein n=1 Tax=Nocardia sp. NPDC050630 TaxID=3364321 RepID=UPI0037A43C31